MEWNVYLSGEIHTDWRQQLIDGAKALDLPVVFTSAVTNHEASDAAGDLLGAEVNKFWRDHKSSKVNAIRTKTLIEKCDVAKALPYVQPVGSWLMVIAGMYIVFYWLTIGDLL